MQGIILVDVTVFCQKNTHTVSQTKQIFLYTDGNYSEHI